MVTNRPSIRPGQNFETETKKVSEVSETILSEKEKTDFKDVLLTLEEAEKLQLGKLTVEELSRLQTEQLKESIPYSPEQLRQRISLGEKDAEVEGKQAENLINELRIGSGEKAQEVKEKVGNIGEKIKEGGIMVWLEKASKEGGILGFFAGLILGIAKMFGFNNKLGEAAEKVEGVIKDLSPEKIKEVKDQTKETVIKGLGGNLSPENQVKLDTAIDGLSNEQLNTIYEKLKKGELTFSEIGKIAPGLLKDILSPEQIEKTKEEIQTALIETLKKEIKEKYNIELDDGKLLKLKELVEKNTTISDETIALFYEIGDKKEFKLKDFFGPGIEAGINTSSIMIGLLINGIIPISAFGMDFAKSGAEVVKISIDAMGIGSTINVDIFNESIKGMSPEQKGILIGLLYRKGGLFLNMIGSIGESISRLGIEFLTNTQVKGYQILGAGLSGNYSRQAELFGKITKAISPETYKDSDDILKKANDAFKKLEQNYKIIDILQNSDGKIGTATKLLNDAKIQIPSGIDTSDFNKFVNGFKSTMEHTFEGLSKGSITSKLGFGASADLYNLESKIQKITQAQRRLLNGNFLVKGIAKLRELSNIGEVSRMGDRIVLHFQSKEEALKGISKWNILANKFPEIVKGSLDKLPIIAVAGIAANGDGPFFEEMQKQLLYLFPIVGPVLLIGDSGLNWEDGKPKVTNGIDAGIGGALLAVDGVFLLKEISKSGIKGGFGYMIKPLKDIYSIGRGTAEGAYSIGKAALNGRSISGAIKESINKSKNIKNSRLRAFAVIGLLGYVGYNYAFEDDSLKEVFDKDGKLDKGKLKEELPKLNDEEKTICFKYILTESYGPDFLQDIDFKITNNTLYINSKNEKVQESWFIDNELLQMLGLNSKTEFIYEIKPV